MLTKQALGRRVGETRWRPAPCEHGGGRRHEAGLDEGGGGIELGARRRDEEVRLPLAERRREARELEHEYVRRASEIAGGLYFATQRHWRRLRDAERWGEPDAVELEEAYDAFATEGSHFWVAGFGALVSDWARGLRVCSAPPLPLPASLTPTLPP